MSKPLAEILFTPLTFSQRFRATRDNEIQRAELTNFQVVRFLENTVITTERSTTSPLDLDHAQSLTLSYTDASAAYTIAEKQSKRTIWSEMQELIEEQAKEEGAKETNENIPLSEIREMAVIVGWLSLMEEDQKRVFLVTLVSKKVEDFFFFARIFEKLTTEESDAVFKEIFWAIAKQERPVSPLNLFADPELSESKTKEEIGLYYHMILHALATGIYSHRLATNAMVMNEFRDGIIGESLKQVEHSFEDGQRYIVTVDENERKEDDLLYTETILAGVYDKNDDPIGELRLTQESKYPPVVEDEDVNDDYLPDNEPYSDEPSEITRHLNVTYLDRNSGCMFYLNFVNPEIDDDEFSEQSTLRIVQENDGLDVMVDLDPNDGFDIVDDFDPVVTEYLHSKELVPGSIVNMMMKMVDRTMYVANLKEESDSEEESEEE